MFNLFIVKLETCSGDCFGIHTMPILVGRPATPASVPESIPQVSRASGARCSPRQVLRQEKQQVRLRARLSKRLERVPSAAPHGTARACEGLRRRVRFPVFVVDPAVKQ